MELEQLVEKMEEGNLSLEEALNTFERGIALSRACQKSLEEAEQKVRLLVKEDGEPHLKPFVDTANEP